MSFLHSDEETKQEIQPYLKFSLAKENFAIPLLTVKEVIALPEVTPIPNTPKYFLGIMNLRGQIISILDLRTKLNLANQFTPETTVIICEMKPFCMGIVVDSVDSVLSVKADDIKEKPTIQGAMSTDYIQGVVNVNHELILLLDLFKALDVKDHEMIQQNQVKAS